MQSLDPVWLLAGCVALREPLNLSGLLCPPLSHGDERACFYLLQWALLGGNRSQDTLRSLKCHGEGRVCLLAYL